MEHAPAEIRDLMAHLQRSGFTTRTTYVSDAVNQVVELWDGDQNVAVRVVAERGQWWVEFGPAGSKDLYDADVWSACLDGHPVATDLSPLDERADFIRRRAQQAVEAARRDPRVLECLHRTRSTRARMHLGLPPTLA